MKKKTKGSVKHPTWTKVRLSLPDLDQAKASVLSSLRSPESQRGCKHAIDEFIAWYCLEPRLSFNNTVDTKYRVHLESRQVARGTINVRLASVRRLERPNFGKYIALLGAGLTPAAGD